MDNDTTLSALKEIVKTFCVERDWDQFHNAKDLSIGIITESAELLDHFRFKSSSEIEEMFNDSIKKLKITEELSDVLFFVLRFAQMFDIDLTAELIRKIQINNAKYPIDKCKGSNKKHSEV
ncbi:nucleotide pyrophosphohydrolase [Desulfosporosinus hippei]|uniref:NTP pyrophosphatase, house-cleaning of non-canonical NTPs n=1 Tax=Desulfosporosinus hippei DSM 8344 TaxID=1121419 RepID=A0A1G7Z5N2_9FIRM|nr:nucleotide pyrophosphohydrolase [Desulfosporosinus hippei]SDH04043.1 NTP pyrophosphatase, house-cleaning of non-canonical NTPs [Desulfosporosinus hippei DSM 8344]